MGTGTPYHYQKLFIRHVTGKRILNHYKSGPPGGHYSAFPSPPQSSQDIQAIVITSKENSEPSGLAFPHLDFILEVTTLTCSLLSSKPSLAGFTNSHRLLGHLHLSGLPSSCFSVT